MFKWGIMGASNIANKFCDAIRRTADCKVVAIGSHSGEAARLFADKNKIQNAYGSYEEMLETEELDAVYIATVTSNHYYACKLCVKYDIPFLCEKTMCIDSKQVADVFSEAEKRKLFCMEAMWSRFLPIVKKVKEWIDEHKIGDVKYAEISLGFCAEKNPGNRFWNPGLGGGAAYDLLVYGYEILRLLIDKPVLSYKLSVIRSKTGVDASDVLVVEYEDMSAVLTASLETFMSQSVVVRGTEGSIIIPNVLFGNESLRYDNEGRQKEQYRDDVTTNGFVYEIEETVKCIAEGRCESETVPHSLTVEFAKICDEISEEIKGM